MSQGWDTTTPHTTRHQAVDERARRKDAVFGACWGLLTGFPAPQPVPASSM